MQKTIDETNRRREIQIKYNTEHNITPTQIKKATSSVFAKKEVQQATKAKEYVQETIISMVAEKDNKYLSKEEIKKMIEQTRKKMGEAAKNLEFLEAAQYRDYIIQLEKLLGKDK